MGSLGAPFADGTKSEDSSSWFGSVHRASVCGLKGPRFNSGQGHVHWLRARTLVAGTSPIGGVQGATGR